MRLGVSQTAFAALADAKKGTQISWEKDASSPTANALIAFAEAGADVLYILTGRRTNEGPDLSIRSIENDLYQIKRALLDPSRYKVEDETDQEVIDRQISVLNAILDYEDALGTPQQIEEAKNLLDIAGSSSKLLTYRATDHLQRREKRKRLKEAIVFWVELADRQPSDTAINQMAALALEYNVPLEPLIELMYELLGDAFMDSPDSE